MAIYVYTDGGARGNPGKAACAFVVFKDGKLIKKGAKFLGVKTNNEAEYEGAILALEWLTEKVKDKEIHFHLDSELVVNQITGNFKVKSPHLIELLLKIKNLLAKKDFNYSFKSIPREKNALADALVNETLDEN